MCSISNQNANVSNLHHTSNLCEECRSRRAKKKRKKRKKHSSSHGVIRCSDCGVRIEAPKLDNPRLHADSPCCHYRTCCQCDEKSRRRRRDTSSSSSSDSSSEDPDTMFAHLSCAPIDTRTQHLGDDDPRVNQQAAALPLPPGACSPDDCPQNIDLARELPYSPNGWPPADQNIRVATFPQTGVPPGEDQCQPCSNLSSGFMPHLSASADIENLLPLDALQLAGVRFDPSAASSPLPAQCTPCENPPHVEREMSFGTGCPSSGTPPCTPERYNMPMEELRIQHPRFGRMREETTHPQYENFCNVPEDTAIWRGVPPVHSNSGTCAAPNVTVEGLRIPQCRICLENSYHQYENFYKIPDDSAIWHGVPPGHSDSCACGIHGVSPPPQSSPSPSPPSLPPAPNVTLEGLRIPHRHFSRTRIENTYPQYKQDTAIRHGVSPGHSDSCVCGMRGVSPHPSSQPFPSALPPYLPPVANVTLERPRISHHYFGRMRLENTYPQYENVYNIPKDAAIWQGVPPGHSDSCVCGMLGVSHPPSPYKEEDILSPFCSSLMSDTNTSFEPPVACSSLGRNTR